jgi:hypothetical protein
MEEIKPDNHHLLVRSQSQGDIMKVVSVEEGGKVARAEKVVRYLQSPEEARIFAFFLTQERRRHLDDIAQIDITLAKIRRKFGVVIEDSGEEVWTECPD